MEELNESNSPRDTESHGTLTTSTVVESRVVNASLFGYAKGEARGMVVKVRIALYKICCAFRCYDSDMLAAMEHAIVDYVDGTESVVVEGARREEMDQKPGVMLKSSPRIKLILGIFFDKIEIQILRRPDQPPAVDISAKESTQRQDEEAADLSQPLD
ncbi:Subtilisin-like protease SBT1.8 [Sesamum angolense]|uniref:Subtilisin-like protease SBT1.8 n=1 Tax=Sesamum angolense TaxID=2727404 RepID=A0AAE1WWI8_9LAMI|nr:Subtilisin-like protease SBT1.8 [Sesamum angolense]